jgi:transposase
MEINRRDWEPVVPAISAPETRRRHAPAFKLKVVEETLAGESVSIVSRRHNINANQVFKWRKLYREGKLGQASPALLPVEVAVEDKASTVSGLEVTLADGTRLCAHGDVGSELLRVAILALRS